MKSIKHILMAAFVTLGVFSAVLYTSCTKDACKGVTCNNGGTCSGGNCTCVTGYFGSSCDSVYRNGYVGTFKGNGSDNTGGTYTGFYMVFSNTGSSVTSMQLVFQDNTTAPIVSLPITLTTIGASSSVFTITSTVSGGFTYTGTGSISNSIASATLTETDNTTAAVTIYTYTNMARQ